MPSYTYREINDKVWPEMGALSFSMCNRMELTTNSLPSVIPSELVSGCVFVCTCLSNKEEIIELLKPNNKEN